MYGVGDSGDEIEGEGEKGGGEEEEGGGEGKEEDGVGPFGCGKSGESLPRQLALLATHA